MAAGNPFWDLHDGIWDLLEDTSTATDLLAAGKHFTNLIESRNRIKFTGDSREPIRQVTSTADRPEAMVWATQTRVRDRRASNADSIALQWEVIVRTKHQSFGILFDLQWAVIRQLVNWDSLKTTVKWGSEYPVKIFDILTSEDSLINRGLNQNLKGWTSVWQGYTELWFSHANLIA